MIVLVVTACPAGLRGDLTKWLTELAPGTFVGAPSARVRDLLWERTTELVRDGRALMVYSANNEQGSAKNWVEQGPAAAAAWVKEFAARFPGVVRGGLGGLGVRPRRTPRNATGNHCFPRTFDELPGVRRGGPLTLQGVKPVNSLACFQSPVFFLLSSLAWVWRWWRRGWLHRLS